MIPFQLAPAIALAAGECRLVLADEVGLGKTIQAGWIVSDLVTRDPAARVLIAVPAGVRPQWTDELTSRFAIDVNVADARWLRGAVADRPAGVSPWAAPGVYLGSIDFLKRPDVADSIPLQVWDLLIADEAHTATAPTDRHAAIVRFAAVSRRVVAITATPFSGDASAFAPLARIGETANGSPPLMFRRSREDVGDPRRRRHHFARVRITAPEVRLQRMLERYSREVWNADVEDSDGARLAVTILRKRALSSAAAAGRSLRRRLELLEGRTLPARQLLLFDDERVDDEVGAAALGIPGLADAADERRRLSALIAAADAAQAIDSKLRYLQRLVRRLDGESIVVFTEYRDTLLLLANALPPSLQLHGGLPAGERSMVQRRFNERGGLLLATDAAAEGLNLHHRCRVAVNYELPWSPARLEQRIGRVDRIGQSRLVHAITLTARDSAEDLVIRNLARRLYRVVSTLGPGDRLGAFLNDAQMAGIVIGGDTWQRSEEAAEPTSIVRDNKDLRLASIAAARLTALKSAERVPIARDDRVLVSQLRARNCGLRPGHVIAVTCDARTGDTVAARQQFLLHVTGTPARPRTAAQARRVADDLREIVEWRTAIPEIDRWFSAVQDAHTLAVQRRIARETDLRDSGRDRGGAIQPGLFDRPGVSRAERSAALEDARLEEHQRHIAALERSRVLVLACDVSAVLVLWR